MNGAERPFEDATASSDDEAMLRRLLSELAAGRESAPDLTDRVMGRLGFVRCTSDERRRCERSAALRRAAVVALMVLAAFAGFLFASRHEPTQEMAIPPALGGVIERHGQSLRVVLDGLPRWEVPGAMPVNAVMHAPGAVSVIFVPVPGEHCDGPNRRWIDDASDDATPPARTAARLPFPEA